MIVKMDQEDTNMTFYMTVFYSAGKTEDIVLAQHANRLIRVISPVVQKLYWHKEMLEGHEGKQ